MGTKTFFCLVVLTASVATSSAIVGYANVPNPRGYSFQSNPLSAGLTNGANEVLVNGSQDGDQVLIWKGHGWGGAYVDSSQPTGFSDSGGIVVPAPLLTNGIGYLYYNAQTVSNNITYVGTVRTGTNIVNIPAATGPQGREYSALGSPLPYAGGISSVLQFTNNGALDGDAILILKTLGGLPKGFEPNYFDFSSPSGFSDSGGTPVPQPQIGIGQGFLFQNQNGPPVVWKQILNP